MAKKTTKKTEDRAQRIKALSKTETVKEYLRLQKLEQEEMYAMAEAVIEEHGETLTLEEQIIRERMRKTFDLMLVKGKEYQRNGDKLHNFRRAAEMSRSNMPRELHGMLQKHIVSYYDMLDDIDQGKVVKPEVVDEKIGDIIVYFHLQEVAIKETIKEK